MVHAGTSGVTGGFDRNEEIGKARAGFVRGASRDADKRRTLVVRRNLLLAWSFGLVASLSFAGTGRVLAQEAKVVEKAAEAPAAKVEVKEAAKPEEAKKEEAKKEEPKKE